VLSMSMVAEKSAKVLLIGSVTDETQIQNGMEWQLDVCSTEAAVALTDDTAKADSYAAIRETWATEGRAEKAAGARAQYLKQAEADEPAEEGAEGEEGEGEEVPEGADIKAATAASRPVRRRGPDLRRRGPDPKLLSAEKMAVMKEEREALTEQAAANAAAVTKQRESNKDIRASKQQALDEGLSAHREAYRQAAGESWSLRDEYRKSRESQKATQQQILTAAAALTKSIHKGEEEEIEPESLEALKAVLGGSALGEETAELLMGILSEQAPGEEAVEAFGATMAEACGLSEEQVAALVAHPEAEYLTADAAEGLCAVVSLLPTLTRCPPRVSGPCSLACRSQGTTCVATPWAAGSPEQALFPLLDLPSMFQVRTAPSDAPPAPPQLTQLASPAGRLR